MKRLAIIPARSGSKGLKDKNIKMLKGTPLMGWTIKAAVESGEFDTVMVSTDSREYAEIAKGLGAEVPFLRDAENATDNAGSWDVVREVLARYEERGIIYSEVCLLQPTSPLRDKEDIIGACRLMRDKSAKAVVSVCECEHSPLWTNTLPENLDMNGFISAEAMSGRQKHEKYYRLNGAIYLLDTQSFLSGRGLYTEETYAYVMEQQKSIDIDTGLDFKLAEAMLEIQCN